MVKFEGTLSALLVLVFSVTVSAQQNRYMVFFKDKTGVPFTVSQPDQFLSQKAIERRVRQGIDIMHQDLPVSATYIQGVRNAGGDTRFKTKWLNGILVYC